MKIRRFLCLCLAICLFHFPLSSRAEGEGTHVLWSRETAVTDTVTLHESVFDNGSRQAEHYISYVPGGAAVPKVSFGDSILEKRVFADALAEEEERVLAGINGDYFVMATGMPLGIVVREGELISSDAGNFAFGFAADGSAFFGLPQLKMSFSFEGQKTPLAGVNKDFRSGAFYLYTSAWGKTTGASGDNWSIVLLPGEGETISVGGEVSYTVESVLRTDGAAEIPEGRHVLCISAGSGEAARYNLDVLVPGMPLIVSVRAGDSRFDGVQTALCALYRLLNGGEVEENLKDIDNNKAPRTALGIREDGSVIFYTVDGRQSGYSIGLTLTEVAARLRELGCVEAGAMDGGASTLLAVQRAGEDECAIYSSPSLGRVRETPQYLLLVAPRAETGALRTIAVTSEEKILLTGASCRFSVGGCDSGGAPVSLGNVRWSCSAGSITPEGVFTAPAAAGEVTVTAESGGVTGRVTFPVIDTPETLSVTMGDGGDEAESLRLTTGEAVSLTLSACWHGLPVCIGGAPLNWTLSGEIGTMEESGRFQAGETAARGSIGITMGELSREITVLILDDLLLADDFESPTAGSAAGLRWSGERNRDKVKVGYGSLRLDYDLTEGDVTLPLTDIDTGLLGYAGFWLYADGSGNRLYAEHEDVSLLLCELAHSGWMHFTVDTGRYGPLLGLRIGGSGAGSLWLDQFLLSSEETADLEPPIISIEEEGGQIRGQIRDLYDGLLPEENLLLTADGESLSFTYEPETGTLRAELLDTGKSCHIMLTAFDRSGNWNSASLLVQREGDAVFADVTTHWARTYVDYLAGLGVVEGKSESEGVSLFDPNGTVTRAEFAVMLCRWLGIDLTEDAQAAIAFADEGDIPSWARDSVMAAAARGLLQGADTERGLCFLPREALTRAQAAVILSRTMPGGRMEGDLPYPDAGEVPLWARSYVAQLSFMGVMNGSDIGLEPNAPLTRAQAAKLLTELT